MGVAVPVLEIFNRSSILTSFLPPNFSALSRLFSFIIANTSPSHSETDNLSPCNSSILFLGIYWTKSTPASFQIWSLRVGCFLVANESVLSNKCFVVSHIEGTVSIFYWVLLFSTNLYCFIFRCISFIRLYMIRLRSLKDGVFEDELSSLLFWMSHFWVTLFGQSCTFWIVRHVCSPRASLFSSSSSSLVKSSDNKLGWAVLAALLVCLYKCNTSSKSFSSSDMRYINFPYNFSYSIFKFLRSF